ncbi:MAG: DinB family protein [Bacteroidetes bacterium]|nr:DinB family protein [Bacteroidota bacterium]
MQKPLPTEHREYFSRYIDLVPDGNYTELLQSQTTAEVNFYNNIPANKHDYRYAEGKWTPKEVLLHVIDTERIFSYRALVAARGDNNSILPSMDENLFAANADVSNRTMRSLVDELAAVRTTTKILFENMTEAETKLTANASGFNTSARALGYMIIGHAMHHINITKERYL